MSLPIFEVLNINDCKHEESIAGQVAVMRKELCKASPNYDYLEVSMTRTFADRRPLMSCELPSVADALEN